MEIKKTSWCHRKNGGMCWRYLLLQGLCVPSVKTTTYVCNRFNASFHTKDHKMHQAISFYTLLHQFTRSEGKNSLRKLGPFPFWSWSSTVFLYYTNLILIYDLLCFFKLYQIQFKEVKILWGLGSGGRRRLMLAVVRVQDNLITQVKDGKQRLRC